MEVPVIGVVGVVGIVVIALAVTVIAEGIDDYNAGSGSSVAPPVTRSYPISPPVISVPNSPTKTSGPGIVKGKEPRSPGKPDPKKSPPEYYRKRPPWPKSIPPPPPPDDPITRFIIGMGRVHGGAGQGQ